MRIVGTQFVKGLTPFLSPNQQHQSTESGYNIIKAEISVSQDHLRHHRRTSEILYVRSRLKSQTNTILRTLHRKWQCQEGRKILSLSDVRATLIWHRRSSSRVSTVSSHVICVKCCTVLWNTNYYRLSIEYPLIQKQILVSLTQLLFKVDISHIAYNFTMVICKDIQEQFGFTRRPFVSLAFY